jgi:hypothetical protein
MLVAVKAFDRLTMVILQGAILAEFRKALPGEPSDEPVPIDPFPGDEMAYPRAGGIAPLAGRKQDPLDRDVLFAVQIRLHAAEAFVESADPA